MSQYNHVSTEKNLQIISQEKAKELGMEFYFTGEECENGHINERYVENGECVECEMS